MSSLEEDASLVNQKNLRKIIWKISNGDMLTLDEVNDAIYILGCLVDDLVTVVRSWKNIVEGMIVKR